MRRVLLGLSILCAAPWAGLAYAYDESPLSPGGSTLLELGRYHTGFQYPAADDEAHVGRYGVQFSTPVAEDLGVDLHGGYATLDVDSDPVASLQDYTGRYLGLGTRYESSNGDYLNFSVEGRYTWYDVTGSSFVEQSEIVWYEGWLAAGPVLRYGPWRLAGGGYYQNVQGNETDTGPPTSQYRTFSSDRQLGGYLGFAFYLDRTGSIGVYATAGARQGINVVFKREF
jgi:hypothetical protein